MKLETRIRRQLKAHVEKRHGLITAPDALLDRLLEEVEKWLAEQKQQYRISNSSVRMEVVDEISSEIRKEAR